MAVTKEREILRLSILLLPSSTLIIPVPLDCSRITDSSISTAGQVKNLQKELSASVSGLLHIKVGRANFYEPNRVRLNHNVQVVLIHISLANGIWIREFAHWVLSVLTGPGATRDLEVKLWTILQKMFQNTLAFHGQVWLSTVERLKKTNPQVVIYCK